jgi:hypothetical protein
MPAHVRSCFLLSFLLVFSVAGCLPVQAQINGVPASVTSFGFGGSNNPNPGVRASVTSLGPNGFGNRRPVFGNCCANFFLPANPNPPLFFDRQFSGRRHRRGNHAFSPVGGSTPAYIPYAVPYVQETDDDSPDVDYIQSSGPRNPDPPTKRAADRDSAAKAAASDKPEEPVATQPSTVLVFKDGHRFEVLNYAVVGDTLFDFGAGRTHKILLADLDLPATHKANDDRGVDFQIPASTNRQ